MRAKTHTHQGVTCRKDSND